MSNVLFRNCTVIDGAPATAREDCDVLVEDGRIREVADGRIETSSATIYDLRGRTLMPGLIDCHVHVILSEVQIRRLEDVPVTLMAARAAGSMKAMIDRGFTTVRDAGGADWGLREAVNAGLMEGPRLFIAGRALSQTGGHGDQRRRTQESVEPCGCSSALSFSKSIADGVSEVRKATREELRRGADQIKVMVSGGVASPNDPIDARQYSPEEVRAIVDEATAWNTYVMAHAYTPQAIIHAVTCGVRTIEHGNLVDADAAAAMAEHGAFMVPTLVTYESLNRSGREYGLSDTSFEKLQVVLEAGVRSLEICQRAGVQIGFGTDLLGVLQRDQMREFAIRAEVQSPGEIIGAATRTNATILQRDGELGTVAPGALADLLVVDGNPLEDLGVLQHEDGAGLAAIMKGGVFHKNTL